MSVPTGEAPLASAAPAASKAAQPTGAQQPPHATNTGTTTQAQPAPPAGVARQPAAPTRDIFNQRSLGKALNFQVKTVRKPILTLSGSRRTGFCQKHVTPHVLETRRVSSWRRNCRKKNMPSHCSPQSCLHRHICLMAQLLLGILY